MKSLAAITLICLASCAPRAIVVSPLAPRAVIVSEAARVEIDPADINPPEPSLI